MEIAPRLESLENFDFEKSPIKGAYVILGAKSPLELLKNYSIEDQKLMKSRNWDYLNHELVTNKVKEILEGVDTKSLTGGEIEWRQEILWFWYHHAISCAIWKYKDRPSAQIYSAKALEYKSNENPNKITGLLDLLVNDKLDEAVSYAEGIIEEPEKTTAAELVQEYRDGKFF